MRTLSSQNQTGVEADVTRPIWLVRLGSLRLSSRGEQTVDSDTFLAASLDVDLRAERVSVFNEGLQWSSHFLSGTAGMVAQVWKVYGDGPFSYSDLDEWWDGEVGPATVGDQIEIRLRKAPPAKTPRLFIVPPTFNHVPAEGTEILTPAGRVVLRGAD